MASCCCHCDIVSVLLSSYVVQTCVSFRSSSSLIIIDQVLFVSIDDGQVLDIKVQSAVVCCTWLVIFHRCMCCFNVVGKQAPI